MKHISTKTILLLIITGCFLWAGCSSGGHHSAQVFDRQASAMDSENPVVGPNPFSPRATTLVNMEESGHCLVQIYSEDGEIVRTLVDRVIPEGENEFPWDGLDDQEKMAPSGMYFTRIVSGDEVSTQRMVLVR